MSASRLKWINENCNHLPMWACTHSALHQTVLPTVFRLKFLDKRKKILFSQNENYTQYANDYSVGSNVFFCSEDSLEGMVGLAWIGVACYPAAQYRIALVEYYDSDGTTGLVMFENR